jgi:hypothetical protein
MKGKSVLAFFILLGLFESCNKVEKHQNSLSNLEETINVVVFPSFELNIKNYCLGTNETQLDFFLVKNNFLPTTDGYQQDTDGDGLSDIFETRSLAITLDPAKKYSILDGEDSRPKVSDLIVGLLNMTQATASTFVCPNGTDGDSDTDGLSDCEEILADTKKDEWDSDKDSIPDEIELRLGLNPNFKDALLDTDGDGNNNLTEVKKNSPIDSFTNFERSNNLAIPLRQKSLYETLSINQLQNNCYEFNLTNLPYLKSISSNFYTLYFIIKRDGQAKLKKRIELTIETNQINQQRKMQYNFGDSSLSQGSSDED